MFFCVALDCDRTTQAIEFCARKTSFVTDISVDLDEEPNSGSEMRRFKECHAKIPATDNSDVPAGLLWD